MIKSGLVSVSFRNLDTDTIINMVKKSGLDAIEWGGDIHVPHGDTKKAQKVHEECMLNNITCPSYGSYYRIGEYDDPNDEFMSVIECASALNAKTIRVWAGTKGTEEADEPYIKKITDETIMICKMAAGHGINVAFEYHRNTLTDNISSAVDLLESVNADNLYSYWQPEVGMAFNDNINVIKRIRGYVSNIHVFKWDELKRLPLREGQQEWKEYLKLFREGEHFALLEFVADDSTDQFFEDAEILKELINDIKIS